MMSSLPLVGSERKNLQTPSGTLSRCQRWMGPLESSWKEMRLQGTKRRCLSSDARCLGITTTWSLSTLPAALLAPGLLSIHSTLLGSLLCRDQRQPNPRTGTPIVRHVFVSLITRELWLCEDAVLFVCVQFCHKSFPCDFLESEARRTGEDFPDYNWLCGAILYLQWGHWLLHRFPGTVFVTEVLVTAQYLGPSKEKRIHYCRLVSAI